MCSFPYLYFMFIRFVSPLFTNHARRHIAAILWRHCMVLPSCNVCCHHKYSRGSQHDLNRERSVSPDYYGSRRFRCVLFSFKKSMVIKLYLKCFFFNSLWSFFTMFEWKILNVFLWNGCFFIHCFKLVGKTILLKWAINELYLQTKHFWIITGKLVTQCFSKRNMVKILQRYYFFSNCLITKPTLYKRNI